MSRDLYVRTEYPEFSWSHSRQQTLDLCARRYYWHYYRAHNGWEAAAPPEARVAWRLKKLTAYPLELGSAVHVQARRVALAVAARQPVPEYHALRESVRGTLNRLYERSKDRAAFLAAPGRHVITADAYYGREVDPELFARMREKMGRCLTNLLDQPLWDEVAAVAAADVRVIDDMSTVTVDGVTVYVAPDLVFRTRRDGWVVVDWKTGGDEDVEAQLALYALFLRDGLRLPARHGGYQGRVVQLENGRTQTFDITADDIEIARARVGDGVRQMRTLLADSAANVAKPADAFALVADRRPCRFCNYRELCQPELAAMPELPAPASRRLPVAS